MAQEGQIFRKEVRGVKVGPWYLRYRDNFIVNGQIIRKQKCVKLADYGDRYRRKSDVKELAKERMSEVQQASQCPRSSDPFISYVENTWLPFVERKKKPSTYAGYRSYWLRYIKPRVGKYAVRDFTVAVVSNLLDDIARMHAVDDPTKNIRSVNVDTVGKIRSILSAIFTYAMGKGHFPGRSAVDNPASCALIPESATQPKETVAATREEVKSILAHLDTEEMILERAAVALVAYTGIRPGEARGLRWEEWNRTGAQIKVVRSVWHAVEGTTKTAQSNRFVTVTDELRVILLALWKNQSSPLGGYILAHSNGGRVNLDNMSKRSIVPALSRCGICKEAEDAEHEGHAFQRDETLPYWHGWYSLRRFHGTQVRQESGNSETMSKALGNSKAVADKHYLKSTEVLPDVRKAVNDAMRGLTGVQPVCN